MTLCRSCCIHQTLQFQGSDHILALAVSILIILIKLDHIKTGCHNNGSVFLCYDLVLLLIINGSCCTVLSAGTAFAGFELNTVLTVDHRYIWDGLCKRNINGTAVVQSTVKFIRNLLGWTFLGTYTTTCTFAHVYTSGFFTDIYCKITYKAADLLNFAVCIDIDLLMSCSFYHLRGKDTCGAVQGWECFVQLGHSSTNAGKLFHNIHFISCICNIKCRLDTCNTAADHQGSFCNLALSRLKRRIQIYLCNGCSCKDHSFLGCFLHIFVDPGAVLTDICDLYHVWIQACLFRCFTESSLMHTRGTGTYYNSCQLFLFNGINDLGLSCFRAHILIILCMDYSWLHFCHFNYFFYIYCCCDIGTTVTYKYTYSLHQSLTSCIF